MNNTKIDDILLLCVTAYLFEYFYIVVSMLKQEWEQECENVSSSAHQPYLVFLSLTDCCTVTISQAKMPQQVPSYHCPSCKADFSGDSAGLDNPIVWKDHRKIYGEGWERVIVLTFVLTWVNTKASGLSWGQSISVH